MCQGSLKPILVNRIYISQVAALRVCLSRVDQAILGPPKRVNIIRNDTSSRSIFASGL